MSYELVPSVENSSYPNDEDDGSGNADGGPEYAGNGWGPLPTNPGSRMHSLGGCKPCNKYNSGRRESCKHGDLCEFCHMNHDRAKHRGQRGRHALQRRQYLEHKSSEPKWFVDLVDEVYAVPHKCLERVKEKLHKLDHAQVEKAVEVIDRIRAIGEEAQSSRPDHSRLHGQRIVVPDKMTFSTALTELDSRCKWLVGTLHLMVRKMKDSLKEPENPAKEDEEAIAEKVQTAMQECRWLPDLVDVPLPDGSASAAATGSPAAASAAAASRQRAPAWVEQLTDNMTQAMKLAPKERSWLVQTIASLAMEEEGMQASEAYNEAVIDTIQRTLLECERLPRAIPGHWKAKLEAAASLAEFSEAIGEHFMDMLAYDLSESLESTAPGSKAELMDLGDAKIAELPPGCEFLGQEIREALEREASRSEGEAEALAEAQRRLEAVREACKSVPSLSAIFGVVGLEQEARTKILAKLTGSPDLAELADRLVGLVAELKEKANAATR